MSNVFFSWNTKGDYKQYSYNLKEKEKKLFIVSFLNDDKR